MQPKTSTTQDHSEQTFHLNKPIAFVAFGLGLLLSLSLLSGDQQGRVNLLYLLLLYLVIPLISGIFSSVSLFSDKGLNFAKLMVALPITQFKINPFLRQLNHLNLDKYWFVMQSQAAAVAFSIASLLVLFILLLISDINFVWRSSLLSADDLLPVLTLIAKPWAFWESAQPSLALLQQTQDSRMITTQQSPSIYASWWPFILATQIFYSFILRCLLYVISRNWLKRKVSKEANKQAGVTAEQNTQESDTHRLNNQPNNQVEHDYSKKLISDLPNNTCKINNWSYIEERVLQALNHFSDIDISQTNRLSSEENYHQQQIILVKAWEPPLAELKDYMQHNQGYLVPIDWRMLANEDDSQSEQNSTAMQDESEQLDNQTIEFVAAKQQHLNEWLRLIEQMPQWQLYQLKRDQ